MASPGIGSALHARWFEVAKEMHVGAGDAMFVAIRTAFDFALAADVTEEQLLELVGPELERFRIRRREKAHGPRRKR